MKIEQSRKETKQVMWALFHVANAYDQPSFNLVVFWRNRPSLEEVTKAVCRKTIADCSDAEVLSVVEVYKGGVSGGYRIQAVLEGEALEEEVFEEAEP